LSWRGKYVGWFRLLENDFGNLVPELTDLDIMECVTPDDVLVIPTIEEDNPRNQRKAIPNLTIQLKDDSIEVRITYRNRESVVLLRNLLKETHKPQFNKLIEDFSRLDPSYETILYTKTRDDEKPKIIRKYVSSRLDNQIIERILDESERLRRGGWQESHDNSTYALPEIPEFILIRKITLLTTEEYVKVLHDLKPIYKILVNVKTNRELISSKLSKPRHKRNLYREFIEALNETRSMNLISAEERRKLNDKWRKDEEGREDLINKLKELLGK
jgi:hypothetical protein